MTPVSALAAVAVAMSPIVQGGVAGVVTDAVTGLPLSGAVVAFDDVGRATVTNEDGWYWLVDVSPGPQHLSVELLGYRSRSVHVLVPAGEILRIDLALDTEPIEVETVVVRGRIPLPGIDRDGPDLRPGRRISAAAIRNDPFAVEPDVLDVLTGGPVARSPETGGGLHVRGGATDQTGYLLDGLPVFSPYHAGMRASAWSPETVSGVELGEAVTLPIDALSGVVSATTVDPTDRFRTSGGLSTSRIRLTFEGPLPGDGGFLLGSRVGYPGLAFHPNEVSYLRGEDHDLIGKVQTPIAGGDLRILVFDNRNVVRTATVSTETDEAPVEALERNDLTWRSGTIGVGWDSRPGESRRWSVRAWRAGLEAAARWRGTNPAHRSLESERTQHGLWGSVEWGGPHRATGVGGRIVRDALSYDVRPAEESPPSFESRDEVGSVGVFVQHRRRPVERVEVRAEALALLDDSGPHLLPRLDLRWTLIERFAVFARYVRSRQLAQSLRNTESIAGHVFPPELPAAAGEGSRIATSHTATGGFAWLPWNGTRISGEAYARSLESVVLVAAREGLPYATTGSTYGPTTVQGAAVELSTSAARYGVVASWGAERIEMEAADVEFAPGWAASHRVRLGGIVHPTATFSVRVAWVGEFGRRGTDTIGSVEWEACNLLDEGCEFAGTPEDLGPLGAAELPAYQSLDLSVRKHWHVGLAGRDVVLEAFAAGSNLLGRDNVLAYVVDPETGEREPLPMRPAAPVAVGIAWSF